MKFELHGDCDRIHYMKGEVPPKFLNPFLRLHAGEHLYLVGNVEPSGNVKWASQQGSKDIRALFNSPEIYDRKVLDDLLSRNFGCCQV